MDDDNGGIAYALKDDEVDMIMHSPKKLTDDDNSGIAYALKDEDNVDYDEPLTHLFVAFMSPSWLISIRL